jgi:acyl-CoA synthetase (NDP forming)
VSEEKEKKSTRNEAIIGHFSGAYQSSRDVLTVEESRKVMELSGIPINSSELATTEDDAVRIANQIGYPLVLKIVSPQVIHKTEVGGVVINVSSEEEVRKVYNELIDRTKEKIPDAVIDGILIEEMVKGTELIVGTTEDPQFGPMIMFGVGGIFVEVYKDVSFRLVPITNGDAKDMLTEIKGKALLNGVRGLPQADAEQLTKILMKVSELVTTYPEIKEMDINPLIITKDGAIAADARIVLNKTTGDEQK